MFGFRVPETIPDLDMEQRAARHLPTSSLGYALNYGGEDRLGWDIYIYPVLPDGEPLDDELRRERAELEFSGAVSDVHTMAGQREMTVEEVGEPESLTVSGPDGPIELRHRQLRYDAESDSPRDTHVFVGATGRSIVKMRTTFPTPDAPRRDEELGTFLEAFFAEFQVVDSPGMAGYDWETARRVPLPDDIPDIFGYQFPPRLPPTFALQGHQPLPERDDGIVARYVLSGYNAPFRVFLRPVYDEGDAAEPVDPSRVEARWEAEQVEWEEQVRTGLEGQGLEPVTDAPQTLAVEEVSTLYGPMPNHQVEWRFQNEEGMEVVALLTGTRIENLLVIASHVTGHIEGDEFFREFTLALMANMLVWRPPPEATPPE